MAKKPSRWCGRCSSVHSGSCPERPKWKKSEKSEQLHKEQSGRGGRPWRRKRQRVFERDNYLCQEHLEQGQLVSVDLHGANAGICDHVIPLSQGGSDDESNLQTLCRICSDAKTQEESLAGRGG